jgi:hypothetical protein
LKHWLLLRRSGNRFLKENNVGLRLIDYYYLTELGGLLKSEIRNPPDFIKWVETILNDQNTKSKTK